MAIQQKKSTSFYVKWIVNFLIPIVIALIPTTDAFTAPIKWFLVISVFAIILIATENVPLLAVTIGLPVCYVVFLKVPATVAYQPWSLEIPWLILGGFILTVALQKSGLLQRIAYRCILLFGGRFRGILYGMALVGTICSLIISDVAAKAILLGALALGICNALELKLGSRAASAVGMAALASALGPSYLFYTGSTGNLVPFGIAETAGVAVPTWGEYLVHMFIPQLIYVILTVLVIDIFFKPDQTIQSKDYFKKELASFGKMKLDEKKILGICLVLIVLIATSSFHGVSIGWLFVFAAIVLMLPGFRLFQPEEDVKKINFSFVLFVVTCLSIGVVSVHLGVGEFIANSLYSLLSDSLFKMIGGVWAMGFTVNFALTPLAAYSAFTAPIVDMAVASGINPVPVLYAFIHALEQVVFPYEYAPVLIIYGYGMSTFGRFAKYNIMRAVLSLVCIFAIFLPYWHLIGLL